MTVSLVSALPKNLDPSLLEKLARRDVQSFQELLDQCCMTSECKAEQKPEAQHVDGSIGADQESKHAVLLASHSVLFTGSRIVGTLLLPAVNEGDRYQFQDFRIQAGRPRVPVRQRRRPDEHDQGGLQPAGAARAVVPRSRSRTVAAITPVRAA